MPLPFTVDAVQYRSTCVLDVAVAGSPVGAFGTGGVVFTFPVIVHGSPVFGPPLFVAGSLSCVHQFAV